MMCLSSSELCRGWLGRTASMACAKSLAPEPDLTGRMGQPIHNSL